MKCHTSQLQKSACMRQVDREGGNGSAQVPMLGARGGCRYGCRIKGEPRGGKYTLRWSEDKEHMHMQVRSEGSSHITALVQA